MLGSVKLRGGEQQLRTHASPRSFFRSLFHGCEQSCEGRPGYEARRTVLFCTILKPIIGNSYRQNFTEFKIRGSRSYAT